MITTLSVGRCTGLVKKLQTAKGEFKVIPLILFINWHLNPEKGLSWPSALNIDLDTKV